MTPDRRTCIIGTRTPTLGVNDECGIAPTGGGLDFSGVPPGDYYICAKIAPYDIFVETAENDHSVHDTWIYTGFIPSPDWSDCSSSESFYGRYDIGALSLNPSAFKSRAVGEVSRTH